MPARPMFQRKDFVSRVEDLNGEIQELRGKIQDFKEDGKTQEDLVELDELKNEEEAVLGQLEMLVKGTESAVERMLRTFNPWVSYLVLPLFALANAGILLNVLLFNETLNSLGAQGVMLGLLIGKPLGILTAAFVAQKLGIATLPEGVGWHHLAGMGLLAGMGFTVSLFIAGLAFDQPAFLSQTKMAVLIASVIAGVVGYLFLRVTCRNEDHSA